MFSSRDNRREIRADSERYTAEAAFFQAFKESSEVSMSSGLVGSSAMAAEGHFLTGTFSHTVSASATSRTFELIDHAVFCARLTALYTSDMFTSR